MKNKKPVFDVQVSFYLTEKMKAEMEQAAAKLGIKVSEFIRQAIAKLVKES